MDIIERTQYSADGGKTWSNTEREARADHIHAELAKKMGAGCANNVLHTIETYPDALIQAMRDMGALPADGGQSAQRGYRDALEYAADHGSFCINGVTYAVIPAEQIEKGKSAVGTMMMWARINSDCSSTSAARDWCSRHGVNWRLD